MGGYMYQPLQRADSIRILLLEPASDRAAVLRGSLCDVSLINHHQDTIDGYTALSYVWGDSAATGTIVLGGTEVIITLNLSLALQDLRDTARVHRIWADALCIDQRNVDERNSQVAFMARIYSMATHTIIYLGPLTREIDVLFHAIRPDVLEYLSSLARGKSHVQLRKEWKRLGWFNEQLVHTAMVELVQRPWFGRVWVLQEVAVSKSPSIQCGVRRVPWSDLCLLMLLSPFQMSFKNTELLQLRAMNNTRDSFHNLHYARRATLWDILGRRAGARASDPRDMIFAHMSMLADREELQRYIRIDYSADVAEVFAAAARYCSETSGTASRIRRPLSDLFSHITNSPLRPYIPSWVPDWGVISPWGGIPSSMLQSPDRVAKGGLNNLLVTARSRPYQVVCVTGILPSSSEYPSELLTEINVAHEILVEPDPDNSPKASMSDRQIEFIKVVRDIWINFIRPLMENGAANIAHEIGDYAPKRTDITDLYQWTHILRSMRLYLLFNKDTSQWTSDGKFFSPYQGQKRLGRLENGATLVLPPGAKVGDFAVCLYPFGPDFQVPHRELGSVRSVTVTGETDRWLDQIFLVRQHTAKFNRNQNSLIREQFSRAKHKPGHRQVDSQDSADSDYHAKGWKLLWRLKIEHYTLLGQCGGIETAKAAAWYRDVRVIPPRIQQQHWSRLRSKNCNKRLPKSKVRTAFLAAIH
ncbi:hypothetical protein TruAng_009662 [Truncatella angustata]|nr:hypothetical protein TruAng_009662 [Truncatella angustata]